MKQNNLVTQQIKYAQEHIDRIRCEQEQGLYPKQFSLPLGLQLELTSKCNLYCKHCYNSSGENHNKDKMTVADWNKLVNDVTENGGIFQCIISGGEPLLLGNSLFEIIDKLHASGTGFVLITNGLLVTNNIVKILRKYSFYWVQVSIDDVLDTAHDEFRGKIGSWKKAVNAAYLFSGAGLPLRIAHSVTPENLVRLPEMVDLSYKLGAASIVCGRVMPSGRAFLNEDVLSETDDFIDEFYSIVEELQCRYRGKIEILTTSDSLVDINKKKSLPNSAVIIRPNGDVRMDCTMPFVIGNVLKDNIVDIWRKFGNICWEHDAVNKYIYELNRFGIHSIHKNHQDADIKLRYL
ncbi:radical SAM/SPASM domain-containing protein [Chromatium okenii]|uniref:radical SAM/SPASM domain-containing protein n=1 Tax=Chromatium okenii TaxID=61644 RepID=UPI0026EA1ED3|nr:radical SAM protein [Chromatium okenii]MBV5308181.1 radical SAM protein [Chromatium okenii]